MNNTNALKEICFIVNVDSFFHSHRRPLERRLASTFKTRIIAGYSGIQTEYNIDTFEVKSRVPTKLGIYQLYKNVKELDRNAIIIVVTPVMIILCHFLLRKRRKVIYNFSGLGFLRSKAPLIRWLIMQSIKMYPISGKRVFIVQNSDDFSFFNRLFASKHNFHLELIAGSGYEDQSFNFNRLDFNEVILGYVGRLRKDKGVLDLLKAVAELQKLNYKINLNVWGELDDENLHGFSQAEIDELKGYNRFLRGFSKNKEEIFSTFNWFCLPSNGEGLSKAAIEASSFGLPLILSNVQGNRDMVKGNGFVFEYGDVENLKKVLIKILKLSVNQIEEMSQISRKMFEDNWTMESIYTKWDEILNKYDTLSA